MGARKRLGIAAGLLAAVWSLGASVAARAAAPPASEVRHQAPVRAVDVFDDSLLLETPPALAEVPQPRSLLAEGFEAVELEGWSFLGTGLMPPPPQASGGTPVAAAVPPVSSEVTVRTVTDHAHGGRRSLCLAVDGLAMPPRLRRVVAVRPRTAYRLAVFVRTAELEPAGQRGVGASVEIEELGQDGPGSPIVVHQHLPRERGTSLDWKKIEYTLRTSEATRYLRLQLEAANGQVSGRAYFDDLTLVEVPRLVELLESHRFISRTRAVRPHPLVKRIRVSGHDYRPAVLAPVPTRWRLPVAPADDTLLHLELGALAALEGTTNACFRVSFRPAEASRSEAPAPAADGASPDRVPGELFDHCVFLSHPGEERRWIETALDLAPYAGQEGELVFETHGDAGALALWGNPRLAARRRPAGDERPNVVLIVVDTLRADHLGIEGYERPTSPVLDELARSSVRYRRAYAPSPWTAPSLSSLMTGLYPSQHHGGIRIEREQRHRAPRKPGGSGGPRGWENRLLGDLFRRATTLQYHAIDAAVPTVAERLRSAGYATFGFHSNYNSSGALGLSRGFDRYEMFSGVSPQGARGGVALVRGVLERRRANGEEGPFFVLFHTQDPHIPYRLRDSQAETFGPTPLEPGQAQSGAFRRVGNWAAEFWNWGRLRGGKARGEELERVVAFYDSEIAWTDAAIGELLEELEGDPETVVIFTADHGEEFGDHGQFEHGHSFYDEVLRVPLFIRLPQGRHAGTAVGEPVSTLDVAATILDLADAEPLPDAEGRALLAAGASRRREGIFAEAMLRGPERVGLIDGRYKYVFRHALGYLRPFPTENTFHRGLTANRGREELYDLEADPGETRDLAAVAPELASPFRARVLSYVEETAHGLHVRCRAPQGLELEIASSATFAHVQPIEAREEDRFEIDKTRRRLSVGAGAGELWFVLRVLEPHAGLSFRAGSAAGKVGFFTGSGKTAVGERSLSLRLGETALAAAPAPLRGAKTACRIWQVAGAWASDEALDSATVDQLRALGYMQ